MQSSLLIPSRRIVTPDRFSRPRLRVPVRCPRCRKPIRDRTRPRTLNMSASNGDNLLDIDGNVILDADGNEILSNGAGDACCCSVVGCENKCATGTKASFTLSLLGIVQCSGYTTDFGSFNQTWTIPFLIDSPPTCQYSLAIGNLIPTVFKNLCIATLNTTIPVTAALALDYVSNTIAVRVNGSDPGAGQFLIFQGSTSMSLVAGKLDCEATYVMSSSGFVACCSGSTGLFWIAHDGTATVTP
jgi:hypothetical protein